MNSASRKMDKYLIQAMQAKLEQLNAELPEAEQKAQETALAAQMATHRLKEVKSMIKALDAFLKAPPPLGQ